MMWYRPCRSRWPRARTTARATIWKSSGANSFSKLVPSAERVRFTGSGTEATLMALRLSRLFTGRPKFLKFHGPLPRLARLRHRLRRSALRCAARSRRARTKSLAYCVAIPPNDLNRRRRCAQDRSTDRRVILEPTGGHWGAVPIRGAFLKGLRDVCTRHDRLLIFDEVITGFRVSPGGAQAYYGVTPGPDDAGEDPGGRIAGRLRRPAGPTSSPSSNRGRASRR